MHSDYNILVNLDKLFRNRHFLIKLILKFLKNGRILPGNEKDVKREKKIIGADALVVGSNNSNALAQIANEDVLVKKTRDQLQVKKGEKI